MLTRHLLNIPTVLKLIHTNSALVHLRPHHILRHLNSWQPLDRRFRSGRGSVSVGIVLGELLNQLLETRAEEVVPEVPRDSARRIGGMILDHELHVRAAGSEMLEVVLEKRHRIESFVVVVLRVGGAWLRAEKARGYVGG